MKKAILILTILVMIVQAYSQKKTVRTETFNLPSVIEEKKQESPQKIELPKLIVTPNTNFIKTKDKNYTISGKVLNVKDAKNFEIKQNGKIILLNSVKIEKDYITFNQNLSLNDGLNNFEILAKNESGEDKTKITIEYTKPLLPPVVQMLNPNVKQIKVSEKTYEVKFKVSNVNAENNIVLKSNNVTIEKRTIQKDEIWVTLIYNLELNDGLNNFEILAKNESGEEKANFSIEYAKPLIPPVVQMINPNVKQIKVTEKTYEVKFKVSNVKAENNILLKSNDIALEKRTIQKDEKLFSLVYNLELNDGLNNFEIQVKNEVGEEKVNFTIEYARPLPPNVIKLRSIKRQDIFIAKLPF